MMGKKFLQIFLFNTKGINFVSHTSERERANRRSHVYTYTHRVDAEQRDTTRREGVRRWTWDAIVWASGTCPWLQESAMSYTPTYRIPRRRNAPLAPAGFACGSPEEEGEGRGTEGGRRGERWNGVRGNPTLRRSLTRRASRRKLRACASAVTFWSRFFPSRESSLVPQRFHILAPHGTQPAP